MKSTSARVTESLQDGITRRVRLRVLGSFFFAWSNLGTHCFLHWYRKYYTYTYSETTFIAYVHDFIHLFDMEKIRWWLCFYYHYWPWNKSGEKVEYKILEMEWKTRDAPQSKPQKKKKVSLGKLERTQRIRGEALERVAYDPKSVEKFGGIVE